ncbi:MAG: sarcosine oxidase subunit alpha family protein [Hyphomicrobiaceae bacterium]
MRDRIPATEERFRLATGGRIERTRRLNFTFDGKAYSGRPGDTLASALLANGVHLVGRSFKYHRPRGILAAGSEEPNALVTIKRDWRRVTPNLRATEVELYEGLAAESQNRWPSLERDAASVNDRLSELFPAGFYYKTFMGPKRLGRAGRAAWKRVYEPAIRRMAGLGRAPAVADPDRYSARYAHCDVLVAGAGPAGLAAALAAAEAGASVIVADEQAELGGSLLSETHVAVEGVPAWEWLSSVLLRLAAFERVCLLPRTTVFGAYPDRMMGLVERLSDHLEDPDAALPRERLWQVRAAEIVLATGAIERPLVFPDNDRPGIMLAGAVTAYLHRYAVLAGTTAVVVTASDEGYAAAVDLMGHGVPVARLVDVRDAPGRAALNLAEASGLAVTTGAVVLGTRGRHRVSGIDIAHAKSARETIPCDVLAMSAGRQPTLHLFSQLRGKLAWSEDHQALMPVSRLEHVRIAGAASQTGGTVRAALASGHSAGEAAARATGATAAKPRAPLADAGNELGGETIGQTRSVRIAKGRAFVDFQNDVTSKDIRLATREGFRSIEHVKRYTTSGMATDQGKTSNVNALGVVAGALDTDLGALGHTTYRPPFTPVSFGALAAGCRGDLFDPLRLTPIDPSARARGAIFEAVGQWQRARYFPRTGEDMHAAVARECRAVRTSVGVFDATTLGKIEVVGPGAAAFLDRLYVNALARLPVGRCRYAVMLSEAGFVMDDGIVARLAPDRFHVTTTTGGAARVLAHMEDYLQTEFTDLQCWLTSVTEAWGVIAVQGPKARELLAPLIEDVDLSSQILPHMGLAEGRIFGVPMRLFRVSFTGELGYEVNVPAGHARSVWDELLTRAEALGGAPYGTEAMHVLRAEKGYIIVGQESDGTVTPGDLGLPTGASKPDFVGKRSLTRPDMQDPNRLQLVGLSCVDDGGQLEEGAQLTQRPDPPPGTPASGYVTSSYMSPTLGLPIALALVLGGRTRIGEELYSPMERGARRVRIVPPIFHDPKGTLLHV